MTSLKELDLYTIYRKGINDIANDFYLPCMQRAIRYDRAVGFFNSTIYSLAWSSLKQFVEREGKMRIICSPILSSEDAKALAEGYSSKTEELISARLQTEIEHLLSSPALEKPARVLATLVAIGTIDFKIAFVGENDVESRRRLFHDKVGVFTDTADYSVVFKGSMNETWSGLSNDGNLESVDVYLSWEGRREMQRVADEINYFELLWKNQYPRVTVKPFPQAAQEVLLKAASPENWKKLVDEITEQIEIKVPAVSPRGIPIRTPRPHQRQALEQWNKNGRRGIFEHATGSGKTFTALCAIRDSLSKGEVPLILVPSELLLSQWLKEIRDALSDLDPLILVCGGGNSEWRKDQLLSPWTRAKPSEKPRMVLSTLQTASSDEFRSRLRQGDHLFLVSDEVHRIGSAENRKILSVQSGPRLGLSATPRRAGDPEGTNALLEYFHGVVPPPFTLKDAIPSTLTPYFYYVHTISLTPDEQEKWLEITKKLSRFVAQANNPGSADPSLSARVQKLLIDRARIVKAAQNKVQVAVDLLSKHFEPWQRWIVYCDSQQQMRLINDGLKEKRLPVSEYHSAMTADKEQTLRVFEANGGILVSIRCLDEGVDIPSVSHALILASSRNPREFIQRRGRVLRKSPGKHVAHIHDVLVLPSATATEGEGNSIIEAELTRAIEFGQWAENPASITDLQRFALKFGIDAQKLVEGGFEDDEE
ncbi:MAG: DEAD/DEAH box helicase family protein [Planctomycetota bacterium]